MFCLLAWQYGGYERKLDDERMDDLNKGVAELSRRMDARFESMEARVTSLETRMESRFESLEARFDARCDSMQRSMIQLFGIMFAAFVGLISAQTALLLALL